jgi:hypothetical protein
VFLWLEGEGVDVDTDRWSSAVVLVRLNAVEVSALALCETVLAVELELGNLDWVLARALDATVEDNLGKEVVGCGCKDFLSLVVT